MELARYPERPRRSTPPEYYASHFGFGADTPLAPRRLTDVSRAIGFAVHTALSLVSIWVLINMLFVVVMTPPDDSHRTEPSAND